MSDVLHARFAALTDRTDDSDWLDVRRRARCRSRRVSVPLASAAAAIITAAALGAGGTWLFSSHDREVTAVTHVDVRGQTWRVALTTRAGTALSRLCVQLSRPDGSTVDRGCGPAFSRLLGPTFGARHFAVEGGEIWAGATAAFARRVVITDADGHMHSARTIAAPRGTKTRFRYWAVGLGSRARAIAMYGADGRVLRKKL